VLSQCNRCWRTRGGRPKRLENRPGGAPTVRCGGSRLLPRGSTTLRVNGSHFATLLAEDPEDQEQILSSEVLQRPLIQSAVLAFFYYVGYVIRPEVTSPKKTRQLVLGKFLFVASRLSLSLL
jgi:hypothetical protein